MRTKAIVWGDRETEIGPESRVRDAAIAGDSRISRFAKESTMSAGFNYPATRAPLVGECFRRECAKTERRTRGRELTLVPTRFRGMALIEMSRNE